MSFTFVLNGKYNDILIGAGGRLRLVYGAEEVRQRIIVALRHYWQEYFLNVLTGMPWYELILGSKEKKYTEMLVRAAILNVPGVISIIALSVSFFEERQYMIDVRVEVTGQDGPSIEDISISEELEL